MVARCVLGALVAGCGASGLVVPVGVARDDAAAGTTGILRQLPGRRACLSDLGRGRCSSARGLDGATSVAASPDGRNVYAVSTVSLPARGGHVIGDSVAIFRRVPSRGGALRQLAGRLGCINAHGTGRCARGHALDVLESVSVSPDGRNVYVTGGGAAGAAVIFARDTHSGALTQLPGASGCISAATDPTPGCGTARALANEAAVAVSADGRFAYIASDFNGPSGGGIAVFGRDPASGALSQLQGSEGCLSPHAEEGCARLRGLAEGVGSFALSPDGQNLYAAPPLESDDDAVAMFARDGTTGALTQLPGTTGCTNRLGRHGCARGRGLRGAVAVAASADGRNIYVAGDDLAIFSRSSASGALDQSSDRAGCIAERGRGGCSTARASPGLALTLSPDGRNLYTLGDGIASFARNPSTGALHQLTGRTGCIARRVKRCKPGRALDYPSGLSASPDGANVYVASFGSGAVAIFTRRQR